MLTLLSVATLLLTSIKAQFIQDYALSTGEYDTDCELYSGSVTIISCPKTDTYDVFLTELLTNTTIAEIQNEIKGQDDIIITGDTERDFIRRLTVSDVRVSLVTKSMNQLD